MIQSVTAKNPTGESLTLPLRSSLEQEGLLIFSITGLGSPKASVNGIGGVSYDGIRVNSIVAESRQIILTIANPRQGLLGEENRLKIYQYFPSKSIITFYVQSEIRTYYIEAIVENVEMNHWATVENAVVTLNCPKPFFKDAAGFYMQIQEGSVLDEFSFPVSDDTFVFGEIVATGYNGTINYTGMPTGAIFEINLTSNVGDPVITNTNGNQMFTLDLLTARFHYGNLQSGDRIVINTKQGEKSVYVWRGTESFNIINGVGINDDWIDIRPGANILAFANMSASITEVSFDPLRAGI